MLLVALDRFPEAEEIFKEAIDQGSPDAAHNLANTYSQHERFDLAEEYYQKALVLDYGHLGWRCSLARLFAAQGRYNEALHEVKICLRLNSEYQPAKTLIQELGIKAPGPLDPAVD